MALFCSVKSLFRWSSCSVCLLWYCSSELICSFSRMVRLVVMCNWSSVIDSRFCSGACASDRARTIPFQPRAPHTCFVSLTLINISRLSRSFSCTLWRSISAIFCGRGRWEANELGAPGVGGRGRTRSCCSLASRSCSRNPSMVSSISRFRVLNSSSVSNSFSFRASWSRNRLLSASDSSFSAAYSFSARTAGRDVGARGRLVRVGALPTNGYAPPSRPAPPAARRAASRALRSSGTGPPAGTASTRRCRPNCSGGRP